MTREKVANFLTYLCLFLLPWQTIWIYDRFSPPFWGGGGGEVVGEYWKLVFYAVEFLIVVTSIVRWRVKVSESFKKVLHAGWFFYGAVLFLSLFSVSPKLSFAFSFHILFALMLFRLLLDERILNRKIIWFFVLGLIIPCLLGWWQVLIGWSPASTLLGLSEHLASAPGTAVVETAGERLMRAYGSFPHPNIFGGYLAMGILTILGRIGDRTINRPRYVAIVRKVILILLSSTLIVTFSRSAWLALIVGIILILIFNTIARRGRSTGSLPHPLEDPERRLGVEGFTPSPPFISAVLITIIASVASVAIFSSAIFTRINVTERLETKSISERQSEYQMIGEVIKINPFLGVGAGSYTVALAEKFPDHDIWFYQPMHNSFLLFFSEMGLVGLLFLIYFLSVILSQRRISLAPSKLGEGGPRDFESTQQSPNNHPTITLQSPLILSPPLGHSPSTVWPTGEAHPLTLLIPLATLAFLDHYLWGQWSGLILVAVVLAVFVRRLDKNFLNF